MLYIELYLYDYLKKNDTGGQNREEAGIELWGEARGGDFYICHLRLAGERKPFYRAHMQYLGDYLGLEAAGGQKRVLVYRSQGEICRRKAAPYVSKDTGQIEHFLIREREGTMPQPERTAERKNGMRIRRHDKNAPQKMDPAGRAETKIRAETGAGSGAGQAGIFFGMAVCVILIFLAANMTEALSSYENMREVIEVVKLLAEYK